jgi:hypothetical protein
MAKRQTTDIAGSKGIWLAVRAYDEDFLESMTIRSLHRILMADWDE